MNYIQKGRIFASVYSAQERAFCIIQNIEGINLKN